MHRRPPIHPRLSTLLLCMRLSAATGLFAVRAGPPRWTEARMGLAPTVERGLPQST